MIRYCIPTILLLATACSHVDVGEIDYRRAEQVPDISGKLAAYPGQICNAQTHAELVDTQTGHLGANREKPCAPLLAGKLFRKNIGAPDSRIVKDDVYSIRLEHGLIAFMTEPGFSPNRIFYGRSVRTQIGEIVVLANVFEFGEGGGDNKFNDLTDLSQAKVIYYSPDVEAGQDLNFSNIPLKAPAAYNGNSIGIQIIVLELDRMSSQMQSLLKTLAGIGQQSNLAPSGPIGALLLDLGTSMLTQNNDDTIFEYRFVLDPSDASVSAQSAPFESGRYVIKRTNDRRQDQVWRNLVVDHNTGRLMRLSSDPGVQAIIPPTPFAEETYFTLNVIKHPTGTSAAGFGFKTLKELGDEIETASASLDQPFDVLDTALKGKLADMRRASRAEELIAAWQTATTKYRDFARRIDPSTPETQCNLVPEYAQRLSQAKFEATNAAVSFHRMYRDAVSEVDASGNAVFGIDHKRKVLAMMAPFFLPEQEGSISIAELVDPEAFESNYGGESFGSLVNAMEIMARSQWNAKSCDELVVTGMATRV